MKKLTLIVERDGEETVITLRMPQTVFANALPKPQELLNIIYVLVNQLGVHSPEGDLR